jgi:hypothetical protein
MVAKLATTDRLVNASRHESGHAPLTCDDDDMQKEPATLSAAPDVPPPKKPCCGKLYPQVKEQLKEAREQRDARRTEDMRQARGAHDPRRDNPRT